MLESVKWDKGDGMSNVNGLKRYRSREEKQTSLAQGGVISQRLLLAAFTGGIFSLLRHDDRAKAAFAIFEDLFVSIICTASYSEARAPFFRN